MWWTLSILFVLALAGVILSNFFWISNFQKIQESRDRMTEKDIAVLMSSHQQMTDEVSTMAMRILEERQDLLNRMQSQDLPTYSAMTASTQYSRVSTSDAYVPMSDAAEAERVARMTGASVGFGDVLFDTPVDMDTDSESLLEGMGFEVNNGH